MEIIAELVLALLQFLAELVLQTIAELLGELGLRSMREPFRRPKPLNPVLATIGYGLFGAAAGGLSLWIFPASFIDTPTLRLVNLILTPVAAGLIMASIGAWRRRKGQELIRLDRFGYGFVFALAMAVVRFVWGN